ncbi:MAG: hypothetical protein M3Z02_06565 [Actinomycetota bacterium]|nr:hypothetical protein [Actinomycetota bacterium]
MYLAHAFGQRYELPIPLLLFVLGGAGVVLLSFVLVLPRAVAARNEEAPPPDRTPLRRLSPAGAGASFVGLLFLVVAGLVGSQTVSENIVPTVFWLLVWIAVPLSCGLLGDWTQVVNPFAAIATVTDSTSLRRAVLGREQPVRWPAALGWWPAAGIFFVLACGELIYNHTATLPRVTATGLLGYFLVSAFLGLLFGREWRTCGEVFSVLFATWGRLGYFRFGAPGRRRYAGGLAVPFEATPSRVAFVLLLLVSVSFDGLLATPIWTRFSRGLPGPLRVGSAGLEGLTTVAFLLLAALTCLVFGAFAVAVARAGAHRVGPGIALAGLLPSLLPIAFGYLLAHNVQYLLVNAQLLFPLIGNPIGTQSWPIHLPNPFNDSFEVHVALLPTAAYWYIAMVVIIAVHVVAVVLAHRHLGTATGDQQRARRSEYPWVAAMVAYTMLSLWLLAQPLVKEKAGEANQVAARALPAAVEVAGAAVGAPAP